MIAKINQHTSIKSVLDYLYLKQEKNLGECIFSNMIGTTKEELLNEFNTIRKLKPKISKPFLHISLSIHPTEKLTNDQFIKIAEEYAEMMGYKNNQMLLDAHFDQKHQHVHLVLSRISIDGQIVSDKFEYKRSCKVLNTLELKYNLINTNSTEINHTTLSINKGLIEKYNRTQKEIPAKKILQLLLTKIVPTVSSWDELNKEILLHNASMIIHETSTGRPFGVSFQYGKVAFKGRQLSRDFSFNSLTKQIQENYERKYGTSSRTTVESEQTKQRDLLFKSRSGTGTTQDIEKIRRSNNLHNEEDSRNQRSINKMENTDSNGSTLCINASRQSEYSESNTCRDTNNEREYQTGHNKYETSELGNNNSLSTIWTPFIIDNSYNNALKHKSGSDDDDEIIKKKRKKGNQLSM